MYMKLKVLQTHKQNMPKIDCELIAFSKNRNHEPNMSIHDVIGQFGKTSSRKLKLHGVKDPKYASYHAFNDKSMREQRKAIRQYYRARDRTSKVNFCNEVFYSDVVDADNELNDCFYSDAVDADNELNDWYEYEYECYAESYHSYDSWISYDLDYLYERFLDRLY